MNWNNNDTKYIFKRILLYLIITGIIFFTGTKCAKATTISTQVQNASSFYQFTGTGQIPFINSAFQNQGEGEVILNIQWYGGSQGNNQTFEGFAIGNSTSLYTCDTGATNFWYDNTAYIVLTTLRCPVNINSEGLTYLQANYSGAGSARVKLFPFATFVGKGSNGANEIIQAQQQSINAMISSNNTNTSAMQDTIWATTQNTITAINNNATQAHSDSQAEQQAINDNTQAVNDLNDNIMQDYEVPQDLDDSFSFSEWFSQEDSDFIRGILLFPLRIFYLISGALDSNSCIEYHFGRLYGYELKLPCINYKQYIGNTIYIMIDTIFALVIVFGLIRYMISLYDFVFSIGLKGTSVVSAVEVFK